MSRSIDGLEITAAERSDVGLVLTMIRELAEFERLLDQVVATESGLERALFGEPPQARVVIARIDREPVGFALFFHTFSTFLGRRGLYLEDLYVRQAFRGQGVGKALLRHLAGVAVAEDCGRFEWAVLDWNQRAIDFYVGLGAAPVADWTTFRLAGPALDRLARTETQP
jgi:GNAT superfamily N-acetyltransferase